MEINYKDILNNQLDDFYNKITHLKNFQAVIRGNTASLLSNLSEKKKRIEDKKKDPEIDESIKSFFGLQLRCFSFPSPYSGVREFIGYRNNDVEEQTYLLLLHKNKQYQWLLVEAYEVFEDFIKSIYGCVGYINPSFWPASDFGDIAIKDIPSQNLKWFNVQATKKKKAPKSILNQFREKLPALVDIEINNKTSTNYRLAVTMIENFRHVIVHRNGNFGDKEEFIRQVIACSGVPKKNHEAAIQYILKYTRKLKDVDVIYLLEKEGPYPFIFYDVLDQLIDVLLAYAFIIKCELDKYLLSTIDD
ncbi:hypothetical protein [Lonsdalea quercina]|uniref:hypothetical protein n=1 Tax=Lonsdalea quercina TaxID=71657 RepID=UPI0039747571